jgi:hypothetical protein
MAATGFDPAGNSSARPKIKRGGIAVKGAESRVSLPHVEPSGAGSSNRVALSSEARAGETDNPRDVSSAAKPNPIWTNTPDKAEPAKLNGGESSGVSPGSSVAVAVNDNSKQILWLLFLFFLILVAGALEFRRRMRAALKRDWQREDQTPRPD